MKRPFLFALIFLFLFAADVKAIEFQEVVNHTPEGYLTDFAGVIKNPDQIENLLKKTKEETKAEIAVVVIDSLPEDYDIFNFAVELFEKWGIGKKGIDNGLLLLISINDREFRIEVGRGLEGIITDITAKRIAEKNLIPKFREENYDAGILDSVSEIKTYIESDPETKQIMEDKLLGTSDSENPNMFLIIIFVFITFILSFLKNPEKTISFIVDLISSLFFGGFSLFSIVLFFMIMFSVRGSGGGFSGSGKSGFGGFSGGGGFSSGGFSGFGGGISGGGGFSGGW